MDTEDKRLERRQMDVTVTLNKQEVEYITEALDYYLEGNEPIDQMLYGKLFNGFMDILEKMNG